MNKISVLLVDDDKINNFLNVDLLKRMNVASEIQVCEDGEQAMNLLKVRSESELVAPDIIFIDINMPVLDGYEFVKYFRELQFTNECRLVMLTTSSAPKDREKIRSLGTELILKPLTEEKIFGLLNV